jgi:hypothetical protein
LILVEVWLVPDGSKLFELAQDSYQQKDHQGDHYKLHRDSILRALVDKVVRWAKIGSGRIVPRVVFFTRSESDTTPWRFVEGRGAVFHPKKRNEMRYPVIVSREYHLDYGDV